MLRAKLKLTLLVVVACTVLSPTLVMADRLPRVLNGFQLGDTPFLARSKMQSEFKTDFTRCSDASSFLRLPGSHSCEAGPVRSGVKVHNAFSIDGAEIDEFGVIFFDNEIFRIVVRFLNGSTSHRIEPVVSALMNTLGDPDEHTITYDKPTGSHRIQHTSHTWTWRDDETTWEMRGYQSVNLDNGKKSDWDTFSIEIEDNKVRRMSNILRQDMR